MKIIVRSLYSVAASTTLALGMPGVAFAQSSNGNNGQHDGGKVSVNTSEQVGVFGNCSAIIRYVNDQANSNTTVQNSDSTTVAPVTQTASGGDNASASGTSSESGAEQGQLGTKEGANQTQASDSSNAAVTETGQSNTTGNSNTSSASTTTAQNNTTSQGNTSSLVFSPDCSTNNTTNVTNVTQQLPPASGGRGAGEVVSAQLASNVTTGSVSAGGGRGAGDVAAVPTQQVSVIPVGAVNAGGGGGTAKDAGTLAAGLTASVAAIGAGLNLRRKSLGLY